MTYSSNTMLEAVGKPNLPITCHHYAANKILLVRFFDQCSKWPIYFWYCKDSIYLYRSKSQCSKSNLTSRTWCFAYYSSPRETTTNTSPNCTLQIQNVVDDPLPPIVSIANDASTTPHAIEPPNSSGFTIVEKLGTSLIGMVVFDLLSMGW